MPRYLLSMVLGKHNWRITHDSKYLLLVHPESKEGRSHYLVCNTEDQKRACTTVETEKLRGRWIQLSCERASF